MRYIKILLLSVAISYSLHANDYEDQIIIKKPNENVNINIQNMKISDYIKLTAKIVKKNILLEGKINGSIDFVSSVPVKKHEVMDILLNVLATKGYTIVKDGDMLRVIRLTEAVKNALPIISTKSEISNTHQMVTKIIPVKNQNVDVVAVKVRHMISKGAKLVTFKEKNLIILSDFPKNIKAVEKIINTLQKDRNRSLVSVKLKNLAVTTANTQASKIASTLFNPKVEEEKVVILPIKETKSLTLIGRKKNIEVIKKLIENMDNEATPIEQTMRVIPLYNNDVKILFKSILSIVKSKKYEDQRMRPTLSMDLGTNSIVAIGPKSELDTVENLIKVMDKEKMQVYVMARIIEISKTKAAQIGAKYGLQAGKASDVGLFTLIASFGGPSVALDGALAGMISAPVLSEGLALGSAIDFLQTNGAADIISEPSILCIDNKESTIFVGQTQSILTSTSTAKSTTDLPVSTFKREKIGLKLTVKPRVANEKKVTLEITASIEDVLGSTGATAGTPTTLDREVKTVTIVQNGETVILGGLIKKKESSSVSRLPLLGYIPLLGELFTHRTTNYDNVNLVITLTPYIISSSSSLSQLRVKLTELQKLQSEYYEKAVERLKKHAED